MVDALQSSWADLVSWVLIVLGSLLALRGVRRCVAAFPRPRAASMEPLGWMRGFRATLFGLAVAGVGAGWFWGLPWLIALSIAIGGEETLESSIAIQALRAQPRIRPRTRAVTDVSPRSGHAYGGG